MSTMTAILLMAFSLTSCNKEEIIPSSNIPSEITTYITTHFPQNSILQAVEDKEGFTKTYEITLSEGIKLEFDNKYSIIEIDGRSKLPDSVIPTEILNYVTTNYSGYFITKWELEGKNQQVKLDNGLELEFNSKGEFLRID